MGRAVWWLGTDQTACRSVGTHIHWKSMWNEEHEPKTCRADIPDTIVQQTHKSNLSQSSYKVCLIFSFQDKLFQLFNLEYFYFKLSKDFHLRGMHCQWNAKFYIGRSRGD